MIKIMIIDTQGPIIPESYRRLLPGLGLVGFEPPSAAGLPCHPHGAFCGWLAGVPLLGAGQQATIIFCRVFGPDADWLPDAAEHMLALIRSERPDYISNSWGAWDGDNKFQNAANHQEFLGMAEELQKLQADIGFTDFRAAGNNDKNDEDDDVDMPQALFRGTCNIIGACTRGGTPTEWSGDGRGVKCVMWADRIYSPDLTGAWNLWSGTSAATPKACGAAAALGLNHAAFERELQQLPPSCRPKGKLTLPHPKFGYGCFEDAWQNLAKRVPHGLMPNAPALKARALDEAAPVDFHDYREALHETRGSDQVNRPAGETAGVEQGVRPGRDGKATARRKG